MLFQLQAQQAVKMSRFTMPIMDVLPLAKASNPVTKSVPTLDK
jgi:hypothetical protein